MNTTASFIRHSAGLICAGAVAALSLARASAADAPAQADAFPTFESYIKVSGQSPWITGDSAAFATRNSTPSTGSGGIEDLYYTKDVTNDSTIKINGRALGGSDDYLASFNLTTSNVGSIDAGYKSFRTFYDGVGGFFPLNDSFQKLSYEQLHVDRGSFWVSATLNKPDRPVFNISFHDDSRTGQKDSSEWGPIINPLAVVSAAGVLVGTAAPTNTPYTSPNVLNLDEHHQIIDASMIAKFGRTTETLKATFDWANNDDFRSYMKYPNPRGVIADPTVTVYDDQESYNSRSFRILNQTETKFNEHFSLDVGLTYMHLSTKIGGNWISPTYSATLNTVYPVDTAADIYGGSKVDDYVGNAFLRMTPNPNWQADVGFREESNNTSSSGGFMTTALATGATSLATGNFTVGHDLTYQHDDDHIATPEASLEYTGISRVSLYAKYDDRVDHGNQHWINPYASSTTTGITGVTTTATAPIGSVFFQDANQDNEDAKVGANWNESTLLTVRAEVFRKDHQNRFIGANDIIGTASYGALYVTGYTFTGVKLSVIFKPLPNLSFSTRYQPQSGKMSVTANAVTGGVGNDATSGKVEGQMISETVDWNPSGQVYLQGNVNLVYNYIQTAYPFVTVVATSPAIPSPIQNANNNYIAGSALCGFVLTRNTDAQLQAVYNWANNYNPQVALGGQPYGSSYEEESITGGLKHKFSDRLFADGKLGYLRRTDPTTGGFTNYHGPLAYVSLTFSL